MKFKRIISKTSVLGMAGALMLTGCGASTINNKNNNDTNKIAQEEIEDLPYMIYDVSYYTDENGQAHEVRHVSQIVENKAEKVINYMPENKDYNYNCYEATQMEAIFGDYYYYIDLNENDEMCNPEQFEEEAMEYFGEKNHPSRLHIVVTQYSLPEGAYITENTVDHTCYIDNVIEEAQTLKLK